MGGPEVKGGSFSGRGGRVVRVCGALGDVVHGLLFEAASGERLGVCLENSLEPMDATDDDGLARRNGRWEALRPGELYFKRGCSIHGSTNGTKKTVAMRPRFVGRTVKYSQCMALTGNLS